MNWSQLFCKIKLINLKIFRSIMFGLGHWEIILILVIVLIVFGAGKLPKVAGEIAKGIKSFKEGLKDDNNKKN
tara:strand:- start:188 stop:406 length:219 start_codon:yes stop_codon:yes gene_type:complete